MHGEKAPRKGAIQGPRLRFWGSKNHQSKGKNVSVSSVQSLSHVRLFATP